MKLISYELDNIENTDCIKAVIENKGELYNVLEWINYSDYHDNYTVEQVDSHIKMNDDIGDLDINKIYHILDEILVCNHPQ